VEGKVVGAFRRVVDPAWDVEEIAFIQLEGLGELARRKAWSS
jgi:hypothetical protein